MAAGVQWRQIKTGTIVHITNVNLKLNQLDNSLNLLQGKIHSWADPRKGIITLYPRDLIIIDFSVIYPILYSELFPELTTFHMYADYRIRENMKFSEY